MNVRVRSTALNSAFHASVVISEEHAIPDLGPFGRLGMDGRHNQVSVHTVGEYRPDGAEDQKPLLLSVMDDTQISAQEVASIATHHVSKRTTARTFRLLLFRANYLSFAANRESLQGLRICRLAPHVC
jgi:hypothetical protein